MKSKIKNAVVFASAFIMVFIISCKKKEPDTSIYVKNLSEIASQYNSTCPKEQANGTRLESVTFEDSTLTYRLSLTDEAFATIETAQARDSILHTISDKLKNSLVKGHCTLEYKYLSPNDSLTITIGTDLLTDSVSSGK